MRTRVLLACLALITAGCAAAPIAQRPAATSRARGGTAVVAWQEPSTLHPFYSTGTITNALVYGVAIEGLVRIDPDGNPSAVLARDVPTIANGGVQLTPEGTMTVRYALRPNVVWSDGVALSSADVTFTWQSVMHDPLVATREGYDLIDDVETPDDLTAIVRYRQPYPAYATRFDALLPRHVLEGQDASRTDYPRRPIGTGPFVITEFASGDHVTAERNPRYRDAARPFLDRVIFRFVGSVDAAKAQLRTGEVDVAASLGEADVPELEADRQIRVETAPSPAVETLAFNVERVGDTALRRALLQATPKERIVEKLLFAKSRAGRSEIPIGWASPALAQDGYDPSRAARTLDDAGWATGPDGIRAKDGRRASLSIVSTTGNKLREQVEQVLLDEWRAIGVEATIHNVPNAVLTGSWQTGGVRKRGDFDVVLAQTGLSFGASDPQSYLAQRRRCASIPRADNNGAGANYERACDPRVDALLDEAGRTLDQARRRDLYAQALAAIDATVPDIYLFDRGRFDAHRATLGGVRTNGWDVLTWNVAEWYRSL
ncbi:MAG: peptide ABC transporter substrate-binding protein [Chloroflexi bacterium]|nr:MAG: peptide ABC transporter substrate-binding protein [Chloroflexota bacterium]